MSICREWKSVGGSEAAPTAAAGQGDVERDITKTTQASTRSWAEGEHSVGSRLGSQAWSHAETLAGPAGTGMIPRREPKGDLLGHTLSSADLQIVDLPI